VILSDFQGETLNIRDLIPEGRIAHIVYEDTVRSSVDASSDVYYCIWKEAGVEPPNLAVSVYGEHGLMRSGEYRLTQVEALQLVVDLMGGVSI